MHSAVEIEQKAYNNHVGERIAFPFLFNHKALFYFVGQGFYSCRLVAKQSNRGKQLLFLTGDRKGRPYEKINSNL